MSIQMNYSRPNAHKCSTWLCAKRMHLCVIQSLKVDYTGYDSVRLDRIDLDIFYTIDSNRYDQLFYFFLQWALCI